MKSTTINPESLGAPKGYSNGLLFEPGGRMLFIAGQVAWDQNQKIVSYDFAEQFDQALANLMSVAKKPIKIIKRNAPDPCVNQPKVLSKTTKQSSREMAKVVISWIEERRETRN